MELLDTITVKDYQKICSAVGWEYIDDKEVKKALKKSHFLVSAKAGGGDCRYGKNNQRQSNARNVG